MIKYFYFILSFAIPLSANTLDQEQETLLHATASLLYNLSEQEFSLINPSLSDDKIMEKDISILWNKVFSSSFPGISFQIPFSEYLQAKKCLEQKNTQTAYNHLKSSCNHLSNIWIKLIHEETLVKSISTEPYRKMERYLIPSSHPMTPKLDALFSKKRVTLNKEIYEQAGFELLKHHRSAPFITIARHPTLSGYLVKAYMDNQLDTKKGLPSWQCLTYRCEGARKIRNIIRKKKFKHFTVASKWIYLLPNGPSPPHTPEFTPHLAILLVTDMHITDSVLNKHAWKNKITEEHLNELYYIISRARGSSYRADNIPYTVSGKFAFIDTEYPNRKPNFKSIRKFLNPEMVQYWDNLVDSGGLSVYKK